MANELNSDEIGTILAEINKMNCALVEVSVGDTRIVVRRGGDTAAPAPAAAAPATVPTRATAPAPAAAPMAPTAAAAAAPLVAAPAGGTTADAALAHWTALEAQGKARLIRAPIIGTFYRSKAPGEPPFVEVGSRVQPGDTLGLMEVMKLFNSLIAEVNGTVGAIFADNGTLVEFDQPVLAIALG